MRRADVNYNLLGEEVRARLSRPRYALAPIENFEVLLQYGCSKRATAEPVGVPILRMNNLQAEGWDFSELKYVALSPSEIATWKLEAGDILFNRTNSKELVGKCEVFNEEGEWVFASYLMRLRVNPDEALPQFVCDFLTTRAGRVQIDRESRQIIGMSNINAGEIRSLRVPLPKVPVQERLTAAMDAARKTRKRMLAEAHALLHGLGAYVLCELGLELPPPEKRKAFAVRLADVRTRFDADFHSPVFRRLREKIEHGAARPQTIESLCSRVESGFAAGGDAQTNDPAIGIPHIRPTSISTFGDLELEGTKMVPRASVPDRDLLKQGEVLFNNTNSTALVGKTTVFEVDQPCACSNHVTRLGLRNPDDSPHFLAALLNALRELGFFGLLSTNFNNQAGINSRTLEQVRIPVPKPKVQVRIANEVRRRRDAARRLQEEAGRLWELAKEEFEEALLGGPLAGSGDRVS